MRASSQKRVTVADDRNWVHIDSPLPPGGNWPASISDIVVGVLRAAFPGRRVP